MRITFIYHIYVIKYTRTEIVAKPQVATIHIKGRKKKVPEQMAKKADNTLRNS